MVSVGIFLPTAPGLAQSFTSNGLFSTTNRSIWSDGPAFVFDTGQKFLGTNWNLGKTIGGIDTTCFLGVCASFGAQIGAQTTGRVGLDYSLTVNGGSFDLLYPGQTTITVPTGTSGTPGNPGPVTLGTGFQGRPSIQTSTTAIPATLQVTGHAAGWPRARCARQRICWSAGLRRAVHGAGFRASAVGQVPADPQHQPRQ